MSLEINNASKQWERTSDYIGPVYKWDFPGRETNDFFFLSYETEKSIFNFLIQKEEILKKVYFITIQ